MSQRVARWVGSAPLPPLPSRDQARDAAHRELQKAAYGDAKPPLTYRALTWLLDTLSHLFDTATATVPGGRLGVVLVVLLLVGVVALALTKLRPSARSPRADELFDAGRVLTAQEHRDLADEAAGRGEHAVAVRERLRAIVRELEERGVLDPRPGRTTDELSREAGERIGSLTEPLRRATGVFEQIWYGARPAEPSHYAVLVEADRQVRSTKLALR